MDIPETSYATTADGVSIAYQVLGEGPDILLVSGYLSNIEYAWIYPSMSELGNLIAGAEAYPGSFGGRYPQKRPTKVTNAFPCS